MQWGLLSYLELWHNGCAACQRMQTNLFLPVLLIFPVRCCCCCWVGGGWGGGLFTDTSKQEPENFSRKSGRPVSTWPGQSSNRAALLLDARTSIFVLFFSLFWRVSLGRKPCNDSCLPKQFSNLVLTSEVKIPPPAREYWVGQRLYNSSTTQQRR